MSTYKAEVIVAKQGESFGFAISLNGSEELLHFTPGSDIKQQSKYLKLIKANHPEYDFPPVVDITTPPTEFKTEEGPFKASTGYLDDATKDAFQVEDITFKQETPIPSNVDVDTGEVKEVNTNNLNTGTMKKDQAASTEAQPVKKVSIVRKAKWYGACGAGVAVRTVTAPTHAVLQTASDILQLAANGVRNTEAFAINKLRVSSSTREEIKGRIDQRTARIQGIALMPITIPVGIAQSIRTSMKSPVVTVQTA
jgi:hypothetical protein